MEKNIFFEKIRFCFLGPIFYNQIGNVVTQSISIFEMILKVFVKLWLLVSDKAMLYGRLRPINPGISSGCLNN